MQRNTYILGSLTVIICVIATTYERVLPPPMLPGNFTRDLGIVGDVFIDTIISDTPTLGKSLICDVAPTFHSRQKKTGDVKKTIFFVNGYEETVTIYWLAYDGSEHEFADIPPSTLYLMHTYGGHGFLVRSKTTNHVITIEEECLTVADYNPRQFAVIARRSCQDVKFTSITSHPETKVSLTLVNQYPTDITMYWLDFQGNEKRYQTIHSGATAHQDSRSGHGWLARATHSDDDVTRVLMNNTCVYVATNDLVQTVVIGGSA